MSKHFPTRNDPVEQWIKFQRDKFIRSSYEEAPIWWALDYLLEEYRARADFGVSLGDELPDEAWQ